LIENVSLFRVEKGSDAKESLLGNRDFYPKSKLLKFLCTKSALQIW